MSVAVVCLWISYQIQLGLLSSIKTSLTKKQACSCNLCIYVYRQDKSLIDHHHHHHQQQRISSRRKSYKNFRAAERNRCNNGKLFSCYIGRDYNNITGMSIVSSHYSCEPVMCLCGDADTFHSFSFVRIIFLWLYNVPRRSSWPSVPLSGCHPSMTLVSYSWTVKNIKMNFTPYSKGCF